ncbi:DUF4913 domain-containing protein [Rhodococcus marinonascens]|uniref:DUF4913 domain-containing protein n=1 Tax=Rhodococcus marinonascens TaxID=38311 RepID=UPI000A067044|nr:DUF4913 domain-containing protein [Rhodococcus marinonascens]
MKLDTAEAGWDTADETGYQNPDDYDPTDPGEDENNENAVADTADGDGDGGDGKGDGGDGKGDGGDGKGGKTQPMYGSVVEWAEDFFTQVIRRRLGAGGGEGGLAWDERWWLYPEVAGRLKILWYAWEEARVSYKASAMSSWWIHHLEPHLRVILDGETGPMAHAKPDGSFSGWPALPHQPVPEELLPDLLAD